MDAFDNVEKKRPKHIMLTLQNDALLLVKVKRIIECHEVFKNGKFEYSAIIIKGRGELSVKETVEEINGKLNI